MPSEEQVAVLEERLGVTLPENYRQFVLEFNGGYFTEPIIPANTEGRPEDRLTSLFGIGASHPTSELGNYADLSLFDDNEPTKLLPIGDTTMGGLIVLVTDPEAEDHRDIYLKVAFNGFYFLASNMEELLDPSASPPTLSVAGFGGLEIADAGSSPAAGSDAWYGGVSFASHDPVSSCARRRLPWS